MCLISEIKFYQIKINEYSNGKDYMIVLSVSIILCRPVGNISSIFYNNTGFMIADCYLREQSIIMRQVIIP